MMKKTNSIFYMIASVIWLIMSVISLFDTGENIFQSLQWFFLACLFFVLGYPNIPIMGENKKSTFILIFATISVLCGLFGRFIK